MREQQIRVTINPTLNTALEQIMKARRVESPEQCINELLKLCYASLSPAEEPECDPEREIERLRIKMTWLEEQLERKEKALSTLVDLWEECVIDRTVKEDEMNELDDRINSLIRDWYFDAERKDQSGADGGKPGHV
ncbi:MAG: hypothetical protein LUQ33_01575 [Methanoregulaceae archaeon]|nr:hypothetical protein [Methanoregulaceae archaeon]